MTQKNLTKLQYLYFRRFHFGNSEIFLFISSGNAEFIRRYSTNHRFSEVRKKLQEICERIRKNRRFL